MASSSTEGAERSRCIVIEPYELLSEAPRNRCIQRLEAGQDKNKRSYLILVYFDNSEHTHNGNQKAVCHYNGQWCALGYDKQLNKLLAGKPIPEIHQYDEGVPHYYSDISPVAHHYSDNEPERGEECKLAIQWLTMKHATARAILSTCVPSLSSRPTEYNSGRVFV